MKHKINVYGQRIYNLWVHHRTGKIQGTQEWTSFHVEQTRRGPVGLSGGFQEFLERLVPGREFSEPEIIRYLYKV